MGLRSSRVAEAAAAETLDAGASGTGHIEHHQQAVQTVRVRDTPQWHTRHLLSLAGRIRRRLCERGPEARA